MRKVLALILTTVLVLGLVGCGQSTGNEKIGIRGEITSLTQSKDNKTIFISVEGNIENDTAFDKASITVTSKTKIIDKTSKKKLPVGDLKEGTKVEIIHEGPVRESYPVQIDAKEIRVLN